MTSFSVWECCFDYEASVHVEVVGYQPGETITCDQGLEGLSVEVTEGYQR